jgi:hypothetical protein
MRANRVPISKLPVGVLVPPSPVFTLECPDKPSFRDPLYRKISIIYREERNGPHEFYF